MWKLDSSSLAVLEELYHAHLHRLTPLRPALLSLVSISEDLAERAGISLAPWEVWETIETVFACHSVEQAGTR